MSAEVLREAARLMRDRAEAASPAPWETNPQPRHVYVEADDGTEVSGTYYAHSDGRASATADAEHIASWHPAVALAVADCLEAAAVMWPPDPHDPREGCPDCSWLALARAYLGETS